MFTEFLMMVNGIKILNKTNSKKFPYPENDSETDSIDSIIYDTVSC